MLIENSMECNVRVRPTYVKILQNFHSFLYIGGPLNMKIRDMRIQFMQLFKSI